MTTYPTIASHDGPRSEVLASIAWYVAAVALAAVFGAAVALGGQQLLVISFGTVGGLALLFAPIQMVLAFFLFVTLVVVGPVTSLAKLNVALWVPYMLALVLFVRVPMEWFQHSTAKLQSTGSANKTSPILLAVYAYFVLLGISLASNLPSPMQAVVGAKLYIFIWGVFFLLAVAELSPRSIERIWKSLLLLVAVQLPFVLYQRVIEVPRRLAKGAGVNSLDAIVGTFPGTEAGGANGSLVMFCIFVLALAVSLWRQKTISTLAMCLLAVASLLPIALGESKVIVVLLPLVFLILYRKDVIRRPFHVLGAGVLIVLILGGLMSLYRDASKAGQDRSTVEHIQKSFDYILDTNNIRRNGEVGRAAAVNLWYRDGRGTPHTFLVGYGPGASQNSTTGKGVVAARFGPLGINSTTAAGMLWDIGVLGLVAFLAILAIAFARALNLSGLQQISGFHRSALEASAVMMALAAVMVPYDNDLLITPQFQVLFLIALFQIVYWDYRSKLQAKV